MDLTFLFINHYERDEKCLQYGIIQIITHYFLHPASFPMIDLIKDKNQKEILFSRCWKIRLNPAAKTKVAGQAGSIQVSNSRPVGQTWHAASFLLACTKNSIKKSWIYQIHSEAGA